MKRKMRKIDDTRRYTEPGLVDYSLIDYGSSNLVAMYRDYDVFFAHLLATNRLGQLEDMITLRHVDEWDEDDGCCLWWTTDKIEEPPRYVGSPLDTNWDEEMKFFIQIPNPLTKQEESES